MDPRFTIKLDETARSRLRTLCRLCGMDNGNQVEILKAEVIDDDKPLKQKIVECVGIQVMKFDRMPQRACSLCVDKINDFYEFREMCVFTNNQTRKLLNLPEPTKPAAAQMIQLDVESILGIDGSDVKNEPGPSKSKKSKKTAAAPPTTTTKGGPSTATKGGPSTAAKGGQATAAKGGPSTSTKGGRGRKRESIESLPSKCEIADDELLAVSHVVPDARAPKVSKAKANKAGANALLQPKPLNQREKKREAQQKKEEKKRKPAAKTPMKPPAKRVKKEKDEPSIDCNICARKFGAKQEYMSHLPFCGGPSPAKPAAKGKAKRTPAAPSRRKVKIEPNIDINDTFPEDDSFMDTHFGDSDYDYDMGISSVCEKDMPSTSAAAASSAAFDAVSNTGKPRAKATAKSRRKQAASAAIVPPNIIPISNDEVVARDCTVVLERIDLSLYGHMMNPTTNAVVPTPEMEPTDDQNEQSAQQFEIVQPAQVEQAEATSSIVPPITLRIKKEALTPEYDGAFNPDVARNIKRERVEEMWELAGPSTENAPARKQKSKKRGTTNKIYKKPALLAVKIKQELVDHDECDEPIDSQANSSQPEVSTNRTTRSSIDRSLPIITQIHSNIGPVAKSSARAPSRSMVINPIGLVHAARAKMVHTPMVRVKTEPIDEPEHEEESVTQAHFMPLNNTDFDGVSNAINPITFPAAEPLPSTSGGEPVFGIIASVESEAHAIHARIKLERVIGSDDEYGESGELFEPNEMSLAPPYEQYTPGGCDDFMQQPTETETSDQLHASEMPSVSGLPKEAPTVSPYQPNGDGSPKPSGGLLRIAGFATFQETPNVHESAPADSANNEDGLLDASTEAPSIPDINTTSDIPDVGFGTLKIADFADFNEMANINENPAAVEDEMSDDGQNIVASSEEAIQILELSKTRDKHDEEVQGIEPMDTADVIGADESSNILENQAIQMDVNNEVTNELAISDGAIPIDNVGSPTETNEMDRQQADTFSQELPYTNDELVSSSTNVPESIADNVDSNDDILNNEDMCENTIENEHIPDDGTKDEEISKRADENVSMDTDNNAHALPNDIVDSLMNIESASNVDIMSTANFDMHSMDENSQDKSILDTIDEFVREVANDMKIQDASPPSSSSSACVSSVCEPNLQPTMPNNETNTFELPAFLDAFEPAQKANNDDLVVENLFNNQLDVESNASAEYGVEHSVEQNPQQTVSNTEFDELLNTNSNAAHDEISRLDDIEANSMATIGHDAGNRDD